MSATYNLEHAKAVYDLMNLGNAMHYATKVGNNVLLNLSKKANANLRVAITSLAIFALCALGMYSIPPKTAPHDQSKKHNWSIGCVAGLLVSGIVMGVFSQKVVNLYNAMHTQYVIDLAR